MICEITLVYKMQHFLMLLKNMLSIVPSQGCQIGLGSNKQINGKNIQNYHRLHGCKTNQHFPFQGRRKYNQIGIFI
jgi:hypothetical protein